MYTFMALIAGTLGGVLIGVCISERRAKGLLDSSFDDGYHTGAYDAYNLVANACEKPNCKHAGVIYDEFEGNDTFRRLCGIPMPPPAPHTNTETDINGTRRHVRLSGRDESGSLDDGQ